MRNERTGNRTMTSLPLWGEWTLFAAGLLAAGVLWAGVHGGGAPGSGSSVDAEAHLTREVAMPQAGASGKTAGAGSSAGAGNAGVTGVSARSDTAQSDKTQAGSAAARGADAGGGGEKRGTAAAGAEQDKSGARLFVRVYLSEKGRVETVPLETYVRGVVAAEMPLGFEAAALEAQALAARTYIVRRLVNGDRTGIDVAGADVTDTTAHQAYRSLEEMARLKQTDEESWSKADQAAKNTKGLVLTYDGAPIEALYFASSNGYTENSEDVFPFELPYLRSVPSPWDKEVTDQWSETREFKLKDFYRELGVGSKAVLARSVSGAPRVTRRTEGRKVKTLRVGDLEIGGTEAREKLGLRSAAFDVKLDEGNVVVTTYGNGHGVGMSQWGAEGMAKAGKTADQIVRYYYKGIEVEEASKLIKNGSL